MARHLAFVQARVACYVMNDIMYKGLQYNMRVT